MQSTPEGVAECLAGNRTGVSSDRARLLGRGLKTTQAFDRNWDMDRLFKFVHSDKMLAWMALLHTCADRSTFRDPFERLSKSSRIARSLSLLVLLGNGVECCSDLLTCRRKNGRSVEVICILYSGTTNRLDALQLFRSMTGDRHLLMLVRVSSTKERFGVFMFDSSERDPHYRQVLCLDVLNSRIS